MQKGINVSDSRIKPYEKSGKSVKKILGKFRDGKTAGNKDTKILGELSSSNGAGTLSDMPKFTPYNCNLFKKAVIRN